MTKWTEGGCIGDFALFRGEAERKSFARFAVTGYRLRERLAAPVAEIRDVQT
jgi:hypothetical protein